MVRVLSEGEVRMLLRHSARLQHLERDPRVLDAFHVSTPFQLTRVVDAEIAAVKAQKEEDDDEQTRIPGPECG